MPNRPLQLPTRGASDVSPFIEQRGDTAPPERLNNYRAIDPVTKRAGGGTRPRLIKAFPTRLGTGPIQAMRTVARARVRTGFERRAPSGLEGGYNIDDRTLGGNAWVVDSVPALADQYDAVDDAAGLGTSQAIAINRDGTRVAIATNFTNAAGGASYIIYVVDVTPLGSGTVVTIPSNATFPAGDTSFVNTMTYSQDGLLLVCANEYLYIYDPEDTTGDPTEYKVRTNVGGFSGEAVEAATWVDPATQIEYVYFAFNGSDLESLENLQGFAPPAPALGVTSTNGIFNRHWRAGVAKYVLDRGQGLQDLEVSPSPESPVILLQQQYGAQVTSGDWFEGPTGHSYWRFSEKCNPILRPRGVQINGLSVDPRDGSVVICHTSAGWGPQAVVGTHLYYPDTRQFPPYTLTKITSGGVLSWHLDTDSLQEVEAANNRGANAPVIDVYHDIPLAASGDDPTVMAVRHGLSGEIFCAGRVGRGGFNVWKVTDGVGIGGSVVARQVLHPAATAPTVGVRQAAIEIDPTDGHPVFCGDASVSWPGAGGTIWAHMWKLNPDDLTLVDNFDIPQGAVQVSALAIGIADNGDRVVSTDPV